MLAIGLVCGSILTALYMGYQENEPGRFGSGIRSLLEKEDKPKPVAEAPAPEKTDEPAPELKLDYHEVLPNIDEVISQSEPAADQSQRAPETSDPETSDQQASAPEASTDQASRQEPPGDAQTAQQYVLQAGSYQSEVDAESMKAKLALAGFEAVIQRVNVNQQRYYRVRMGPYDSQRRIQRDKKRLAEQGIEALAVRLTPPE